jgi:ABC-type multidrug transport system fused ATPase/permease subunit
MQVAIVGPSGAGKSTLVDLLLGLHHPSSGDVEISGINAIDAIERWPGAVAYVPQEIQLVSGLISDNILLGFTKSKANLDSVLKAMKMAELNEYMENNIITEVNIGDEGGKLSGGQRQRLGIARALFTKPKLLVLDEATSSLDAQTESDITEAIKSLKGKTTIIMIAHRLSSVRSADQVIFMNNGMIESVGTFEEVRKEVPNFDKHANLMGL